MDKKSKILVVDDEPANVRLVERILQSGGYVDIVSTTDSRQVRELFQQFQPDLVLTDLLMPYLSGFEIVRDLRLLEAPQSFLPIVVLTADVTCESKRRALASGATDFLTKPFDHSEVLLRVKNLLQTRSLHLQLQRQNADLEDNVRSRTRELEEALAQLKATQEQMIQQERLRALGTMASGIAHDFNNSLASILGYSELVLRNASEFHLAPKAMDYLNIVVTAAKDSARMVSRLREFSRPREDRECREYVDLNSLLSEAMALTLPRWKTDALARGATINVAIEAGEIPAIAGDAAELREVLTNLIFNAADALPAGGNITLHTEVRGERVEINVRDTGIGMTEETRRRCLEPFFTTKGQHGTGLGLAMVYGIIERHGGTVEIRSELGKGTNFIMSFPIPTIVAPSHPVEIRQPSRPLHILVVDDQPLLCELLKDQLSRDRHVVETALNGCDALEKFGGANFDLVLTDKAMPGMDGGELASRIKELKPFQPVILLTGYGELAYPDGECPAAIDQVLSKPICVETLRRVLAGIALAA